MWITIAVIVGVIALLGLINYLTDAGQRANKGQVACMMPKTQNVAKGAALKDERKCREESAQHTKSGEEQK